MIEVRLVQQGKLWISRTWNEIAAIRAVFLRPTVVNVDVMIASIL
jgi:hypothetical protein